MTRMCPGFVADCSGTVYIDGRDWTCTHRAPECRHIWQLFGTLQEKPAVKVYRCNNCDAEKRKRGPVARELGESVAQDRRRSLRTR